MQPDAGSKWLLIRRPWQTLAICCWLMVFAGLFIRLLVAHGLHSVYPIFSDAARCWQHSLDMYWPEHSVESLDPYRYSPSVALFFSTFAGVPDRLGSLLWLTFNTIMIVAALGWWLRTALPRAFSPAQIAGASLIVLTFAAGNLNNGQANTVVIAMLLIAAAGVCTECWTLASCCIVVATLFKVYPLAFGLLLAVAYPKKMLPRLALGLGIGLALPFLVKPPEYVFRQYELWFNVVRLDDRRHAALPVCYRDLWLLIRVFQLPIASNVYTLIQAAGAAFVAGICLWGRLAGLAVRPMTMLCLTLGSLWMMVLGPATESSTYLIVAPTLAWIVIDSWNAPRSRFEFLPIGICLTFFLLAHGSVWFPETVRRGAILFQPTAALLLFGVALYRAFLEIASMRMSEQFVRKEASRQAA